MGRPIPERLFVLIHGPAPANDGQPLVGNGRAGDIAAQAFQASAMIRFTNGGGVRGAEALDQGNGTGAGAGGGPQAHEHWSET